MNAFTEFPFLYQSQNCIEEDVCQKISESVLSFVDSKLPHMQSIAGNVMPVDLFEKVTKFVEEHSRKVMTEWNIQNTDTNKVISWNLTLYPSNCSTEDKEYVVLNHIYNAISFKIIITPECDGGLIIKNIISNTRTNIQLCTGQVIICPCTFAYPIQIPTDYGKDIIIIDGQIEL